MSYEVWTDPGFQRELDALKPGDHETLLDAVRGLKAHPLDHPQVLRIKGTSYPGSFRLRAGRFRILGIVLEGPRLILLTTLFIKKRESDYDQAIERHEGRLRLQGPPLGDYLQGTRRRR